MDRTIPITGKLVPGDRVPPVGIKLTVCESGDFGQGIELNAVSEKDKLREAVETTMRSKTHHTLPDHIKSQQILHHEREE